MSCWHREGRATVGKDSSIQWCHHTFNPWWGCVRVSPGCENCYAEAFDKRLGRADWGVQSPRRFFGDKHWAEPLKWDLAAAAVGERHRVFCASMADVFEDRRDLDEHRARLWKLIEATSNLDWLLLTKRPENVNGMLTVNDDWTLRRNVWVGTTVEDRKRAADRIARLREIPAVVRFLSCEPLLEDLGNLDLTGIGWVIVGGESGPGARPFDFAWARDIETQCKLTDTRFFMKQAGACPRVMSGQQPPGMRTKMHVVGLRQTLAYRFNDSHGGDPAEWPCQFSREFPAPPLSENEPR
jgi:protein gp37